MESLQWGKNSSVMAASQRFIIKDSIFTQLLLDNIIRMYGYHRKELITPAISFCTNPTIQYLFIKT